MKSAWRRKAPEVTDAWRTISSRPLFIKRILVVSQVLDLSVWLHLPNTLDLSFLFHLFTSREPSRRTCSPCISITMTSQRSKWVATTSKSLPNQVVSSDGTQSRLPCSGRSNLQKLQWVVRVSKLLLNTWWLTLEPHLICSLIKTSMLSRRLSSAISNVKC